MWCRHAQRARKLTAVAQLPLHLHHGLRRGPHGHMGRSTEVASSAHRKDNINTRCSVSTFGLIDGGFGGLIWCYIGVFIGFIFVYASMSEMASM